MSNLSIRPQVALNPLTTSAAPIRQADEPLTLSKTPQMAQDTVSWTITRSAPDPVKSAKELQAKKTVMASMVGGAVAVPLAGAAIGALASAIVGESPVQGAIQGAKASAIYAPAGAVVGLGLGIDLTKPKTPYRGMSYGQ